MTKNMVVQGGCVGDDGDSAVGNRGGSSTMASYIPKKIDGQFFGKRQLLLPSSSLLLPESPSRMETSELMSIRTVSD